MGCEEEQHSILGKARYGLVAVAVTPVLARDRKRVHAAASGAWRGQGQQ
jgi:hypothetical protein